MLKYFSKITMDILPSVAATIIGAYIVNHYITAKPAADAPAAAVSSANPKKVTSKPDSKQRSEVANLPEAGVRAKGISEKAISEKIASEKAASQKAALEKAASEKAALEKSAAEKSADKPAETASIPADTRRHQSGPREKTAAKAVPAPVVVPAVATPGVAAPTAASPVEAAIGPDDHLNANEIARVTLERLRGINEGPSRTMEAARTPDAPRLAPNPPVSAPVVRPLPPPIMVSTPGNDRFDPATASQNPPYGAAAPTDDPLRPTPPADIPTAPPLDLRAEAAEPPPARPHTNVAEDMLSAAKSVFHAVLPKPNSE